MQDYLHELKSSLLILHQKSALITSPPNLPFELFSDKYRKIIEAIKLCTFEIELKVKNQQSLNESKKEEINNLIELIGIKEVFFTDETNLIIENEILDLKLKELKLIYKEKEFEKDNLEFEINKLNEELFFNSSNETITKENITNIKTDIQINNILDNSKLCSSDLISKINSLKLHLSELRNKKNELERNKFYKINEIMTLITVLEKEDLDEVENNILIGKELKIQEIMHKHSELTQEYNRRLERLNYLHKEIKKLESYFIDIKLDNPPVDSSSNSSINLTIIQEDSYKPINSLNIKNLLKAENIYSDLLVKKKIMFKEIFSNKLNELQRINEIFKLENKTYDETEDNLDLIESEIKELLPKKDLFLETLKLIEKREYLKNEMINFEKQASDPKRLFKNSIQLLNEEKFRKTAAPNLIKLEGEIFNKVREYENQFGIFYLNGHYKCRLEEEIRNRIINKNVFIMNGFESPRKKRK